MSLCAKRKFFNNKIFASYGTLKRLGRLDMVNLIHSPLLIHSLSLYHPPPSLSFTLSLSLSLSLVARNANFYYADQRVYNGHYVDAIVSLLYKCSTHHDVIITSSAAERQGYHDLAQQVLLCGRLYNMYMCPSIEYA